MTSQMFFFRSKVLIGLFAIPVRTIIPASLSRFKFAVYIHIHTHIHTYMTVTVFILTEEVQNIVHICVCAVMQVVMIICLGVSMTLFAFSYRRIKNANELLKPGEETFNALIVGSSGSSSGNSSTCGTISSSSSSSSSSEQWWW